MNIFSRISSLLNGKEKAASNIPGTWEIIGGDSVDAVNERNLLSANKEWVYVAVDKVALATAAVRLKVMKYKNSGDDQEVFEGPLVDFMDKPGPGFTGKDFIYLNTVYKELTGNAFWHKIDKRNIYPLIPTNVSPEITTGKLTGYRYGGQVISLDKVLHDRYIDPARPYWGAGKLQKVARWVDTASFANEYLRRFFLNGATFGGFIETEEESEERIKLIKMGLTNDHVGVENAHKMGVLPKGAKFARGNANMGELQMKEMDDTYRDKILSAFGVPKTLVGLTTEVNRASAEASEYIFARYTIMPIITDLVEFLNVNVAPVLDPSGGTYFAFDDFVPENQELVLKARELALNKQAYKTVNEVRAEEGLPPIKGGDDIYGSPLMVPLGQPAASPDLPAPKDPKEDPKQPVKARQKAVPARVRQIVAKAERTDSLIDSFAKAVEEKVAVLEEAKDMDAEAHKSFVARVAAFMLMMQDAVRNFNSRQQSMVLQNLGVVTAKGMGTKEIAKGDLFDMQSEVTALVDAATPLLAGLLTEEAIREWEAQGFEGNFDGNTDGVRNAIEKAAKRLAKSYNSTTAELLKKALTDGIGAGEGLDGLSKRVQEVYAYSDIVRAKAVAHTESFYIANKANQIAYKQSGVVKTVRWYTAEDERVCEYCGPMHGRSIPVTGTFFAKGEVMEGAQGGQLSLNYRSIDVPPLHTNCRCFIRPDEISID